MAKRQFVPLLTGDFPEIPPPRGGRKNPRKARKPRTPKRGGKRGRRGGTVKPTGRFEHLRVRTPRQFTPGSLKTVPWIFVDVRERAFVQKKLGLRTIPSGTKAVAGHIKDSIRRDRVPGTKVRWLASGVQTVLIPIRGGKTPKSPPGSPRKRKPAARAIARRARRKNPGRLAIVAAANPPTLPREVNATIARLPAAQGTSLRTLYAGCKAPDRRRIVQALRLYRKRHGVYPDNLELRRRTGPGLRLAVGIGRAQAIEYHANKGYGGSSKRGTAWRHKFENGQHLVTDERGRELRVADRRGAKRRTVVTDWIYH